MARSTTPLLARLRTLVLPLALPLLSGLAACGGGTAGDVDPTQLLQEGDFSGAITVIESQLAAVDPGSPDHKDLVVNYAWALSESSPARSKEEFLGFANDHSDLLTSADFKFVVSQLRTYSHFSDAIDVMDRGKKIWPEDATMEDVVTALKADVAASGDDAAKKKMAGLGYF